MGRRGLDGVAHARFDEGIRPITHIEERVNAALDKVRPGIAADGGEVWLIKVEGGVAYVQMLGACGGCPASTMTLKGAIETIVRADVPEITEVLEI
ncbi:MAG TPA: NifU family protein [Candidatus Baltobacteraceae bacterium]|jgi:Fe-S cluster biogenesis protein NfuA